MRTAVTLMLAGVLGVLCAVAVGCGSSGSKLLSSSDAASLKQTLTLVDQAVAARDCVTATARIGRLRSLVSDLPSSVDRGLKANLQDGIDDKLAKQARAECDDDVITVTPTLTQPAPEGPTAPTGPTVSTASTTTTAPPTPSVDTTTTGTAPAETTPGGTPTTPGADTGPGTSPGAGTDPGDTGGTPSGDGTGAG